MKKLYKNKSTLIILFVLGLFSCEGKLEVAPQEKAKHTAPKYNFLVRQSDSFDENIIRAEVYIKQLDFQAPEEKYSITVKFPSNLDGEIYYQGKQHRSGDLIEVLYKDLENNIFHIDIGLRNPVQGNYMIDLSCEDSEEKVLNDGLTFTVKNTDTSRGNATPKFNFLVREIDSSEGINAELYINQLDFEALEENYLVIVNFPGNFDGNILYRGKEYRSGDWIEIPYKEFEENNVLKIMPLNVKPGSYAFNIVCQDRNINFKSAILSINIP